MTIVLRSVVLKLLMRTLVRATPSERQFVSLSTNVPTMSKNSFSETMASGNLSIPSMGPMSVPMTVRNSVAKTGVVYALFMILTFGMS